METTNETTIKLYDGKRGESKFHYMTLEEAKALGYGDHVWFVTRFGDARQVKVNGAPKVWKTRPGDCNVPLKYGLYEYFTAEYRDGQPSREQLIVLDK